ncbi:MAG: DNA double-strand break repair nuclease NurA [Candidatus Paceibacteria bacterium]
MINGFNKVLGQLEEGRNYKKKPPHGPPDDFPSLKQEEVERIQKEQDHTEKDRSYDYTKLLEDYHPTEVDFPSSEELNGTHIFAIDGSNQVVGPPAFKPILAKSSIVEFEYTNEKKLKYHNIKSISTQAIFISEAGVFKDTVDLVGIDLTDESGDEEVSLLKSVRMSDDDVPFLLEANNQTGNPVKEAMGWGVKLQQTLELLNLNLIEDVPGVTIRDGPLLSTSADESDTIKALNDYTNHLKNQTLVSISKNVDNSTLIIECLKENKKLRDTWFPDQQITKRQLEKISGDSSVLDKIISPGERTPFVEAVNLQRAELVRI